jgi:hypothetical protein
MVDGGYVRSVATLAIDWVKPPLAEEEWEFFRHPDKQGFYARHGVGWEGLQAAFDGGTLVPWPRSDRLDGVPVALSYHTYDDYLHYLARAKRGYRRNYSRMEEALQRDGRLVLPAPIVIRSNGEALLFSGWRRLCLAWNCGMTPYVWLVTLVDGKEDERQ